MMIAAALFAICVMSLPVFAEETMSYKIVGIEIPAAAEFEDSEIFFQPQVYGPVDAAHHLYLMNFVYSPLPKEELFGKLNDPDLTEEEYQELEQSLVAFFSGVVSTDVDLPSAKAAYEALGGPAMNFDEAVEIGKAENYTFYSIPGVYDAFLEGLDEAQAEKFEAVRTALNEALANAAFTVPEDPDKEMIGEVLEFSTTDLDGNAVTSEELFSQNTITMVNIWGTWCPYCVKEMPELAQMEERLQEKGCGILGLDYETSLTGDEALQAAKEALEEYGVSYPNAVLPEELGAKISSFPTTFFVNRDGVVLTMPIVGAYVDSYEPTLDALLNGTIEAAAPIVPAADAENAESTGGEQESGNTEGASKYRVILTDADGPVEGVMVQMCDDSVCNMAKTDAEGIASFDLPSGISYEVHVLKVPEGYEEDATVYHTAETYEDVIIELVKK